MATRVDSSSPSINPGSLNKEEASLLDRIGFVILDVLRILQLFLDFKFKSAFWMQQNFSKHEGAAAFPGRSIDRETFLSNRDMLEKLELMSAIQSISVDKVIQAAQQSIQIGSCHGECLALIGLIKAHPQSKVSSLLPTLKQNEDQVAYFQTMELFRNHFLDKIAQFSLQDACIQEMQNASNREFSHEERVALIKQLKTASSCNKSNDENSLNIFQALEIFCNIFLNARETDQIFKESLATPESGDIYTVRPAVETLQKAAESDETLLLVRCWKEDAHTVLLRISKKADEFVMYDSHTRGLYSFSSVDELLTQTTLALSAHVSGLDVGAQWQIKPFSIS